MKTCLGCTHCYFDSGHEAYSDLTPGEPLTFECTKGKWEVDGHDNRNALQSKLLMAEACDLYEEEEEE